MYNTLSLAFSLTSIQTLAGHLRLLRSQPLDQTMLQFSLIIELVRNKCAPVLVCVAS